MSLWSNDESENTPLPATDDRTYLTITPADEPLDPGTIETAFERLHQLEPPKPDTWLPDVLTGVRKPTVEWLLVATRCRRGSPSHPSSSFAFGMWDVSPAGRSSATSEHSLSIDRLAGSVGMVFRRQGARARDYCLIIRDDTNGFESEV